MTVPARLRWLVQFGDTFVARFILAGVALLWSVMLFAPGNTFDRPVYAQMAFFATERTWASAWGLYSIALAWRTLSAAQHRLWLSLMINGAGLVLFGGAAACVVFSRVWPMPAATSGDVGLAVVACWVLMRSGVNNGPGWRND